MILTEYQKTVHNRHNCYYKVIKHINPSDYHYIGTWNLHNRQKWLNGYSYIFISSIYLSYLSTRIKYIRISKNSAQSS